MKGVLDFAIARSHRAAAHEEQGLTERCVDGAKIGRVGDRVQNACCKGL